MLLIHLKTLDRIGLLIADVMGLKKMLEELGQPKTHREVIKMIRQIDKTNKGTICYRDFVTMMCSPTASFLER